MGGQVMKKKLLVLFTAFLMVFTVTLNTVASVAKAEGQNYNINIRVEGLNGTIAQGIVNAPNAYEGLKKLLTEKGIPYDIPIGLYGPDVRSINSLNSDASKAWMYYFKSDSYMEQGAILDNTQAVDLSKINEVVIYYCDWSNINIAKKLIFSPKVVQENEAFKLTIADKTWDGKEALIKNVTIDIDGIKYTTDSNGSITVSGLPKGTHNYKIYGYESDGLPKVVSESGSFIIDNVTSPSKDYTIVVKPGETKKYTFSEIKSAENDTFNYLKQAKTDPWTAFTLSRRGIKPDDTFLKEYAKDISKNGLSEYSGADLEKLIFGTIACGYNPYDFVGKDLVKELFNKDINKFTVNEAAMALILNHELKLKDKYNMKESQLIQYILSHKVEVKDDKNNTLTGWSVFNKTINPDVTAMVISSLAPYYVEANVKEVVDNAVRTLSLRQIDGGYLQDEYGIFSESSSFAIVALCSLGIDPMSVDFTKNGGDLVSALMSFKGTNGQFTHMLKGADNALATEQAARALMSVEQYYSKGSFNYYAINTNVESLKPYRLLPATGRTVDYTFLVVSALILIALGIFIVRQDTVSANK